MFKKILQKILQFQDLSSLEMQTILTNILEEKYTPAQTSALLIGLHMKNISSIELTSAIQVMQSKMIPISLPPLNHMIDICGTGGDHANYFNISTCSAIICSAAGATVAKHGNKGVSSSCGSATVLQNLGISLKTPLEKMQQSIEIHKLGFLYAVNHHPCMKSVASIRQELGQHTIFNLLGPLLNPARVKRQLIGVFKPELLSLFSETLKNFSMECAILVHGHNGVDEVTLTGPTECYEIQNNTLQKYLFQPSDYGFSLCSPKELQGKSLEHNTQIIRDILAGKKGCQRDVVVLNSGFGLYIAGITSNLQNGFTLAAKTIDSGKAKQKLTDWITYLNK